MFRWLSAWLFVMVLATVSGAQAAAPADGVSPITGKPQFVSEGYFFLRENNDGKPDTVVFFPDETVEYEVEYSDCLNQIITRDDLERRRFCVKGEMEQKGEVRTLRIQSFEVLPEKPTEKPVKSGGSMTPAPSAAAKGADKHTRPKKKK